MEWKVLLYYPQYTSCLVVDDVTFYRAFYIYCFVFLLKRSICNGCDDVRLKFQGFKCHVTYDIRLPLS